MVALLLTQGLLGVPGAAAGKAAADVRPIWSIVPSERVGLTSGESFDAVEAISSDDAWAVGRRAAIGFTKPIIEHWDGRIWQAVSSPGPNVVGTSDYELTDVAAAASDDVWAVGAKEGGGTHSEETLIERWNGIKWKVVPSPNSRYDRNALLAVEVVSADDVWAAGFGFGRRSGVPLIVHWDGKTWTLVPTPQDPGRYVFEGLTDLAAISQNDIWTVGESRLDDEGPPLPLAMHWDGDAWSRVPMPNPWADGVELTGVTAVSPMDVWVVGERRKASSQTKSIAMHWEGKSWKPIRVPEAGVESGLAAVAALSATNVWAVGFVLVKIGQGYYGNTLVQHWNGEEWRVVHSPNPDRPGFLDAEFSDVDALGPKELWAVGGYHFGEERPTLVERYGVPFCSDGVDNDGDGKSDYPADAGCTSATEGSEFGETACDNGYDDDRDGLVDFPQDPGCSSRSDESERTTSTTTTNVANLGTVCDDGGTTMAMEAIDYPADPGCSLISDHTEKQ